jgi:hypothetical protein
MLASLGDQEVDEASALSAGGADRVAEPAARGGTQELPMRPAPMIAMDSGTTGVVVMVLMRSSALH